MEILDEILKEIEKSAERRIIRAMGVATRALSEANGLKNNGKIKLKVSSVQQKEMVIVRETEEALKGKGGKKARSSLKKEIKGVNVVGG
ncbi:hypothetical protein [Xylocopilactobacillus apicola]|uniref:Phage protein n=1 Tax=Xylocopilactobacillus apicola TaxID=2932184 RepID=A0AAU9DAM0_9LACO|nr:hypothetical protein [Xylocopilactobacillus apicola]BDR59435.1 hypothetical protein XA3_18760 [Xylocopilactobacillus apicola]